MADANIKLQQCAPLEHQLVIVRRKHLGRWISGAIVLGLSMLLLQSVFTNPNFSWDVVHAYIFHASILNGLYTTIGLTISAMTIGLVLGVIVAVMRISNNPVVEAVAALYVFFFRGTPLLVQLLFWYNISALYPIITLGLPGVALNTNQLISPLLGAILGLGLNEAAYMAEIVRGGIFSVNEGQSEGAKALGMSKSATMRRIILPQAMRVIIPPTGNEVIGLLKNTSLVSVMAVPELLYSAEIVYNRTFQTIPLLIVACIWYLVVTALLSSGQYFIERYYAKGSVSVEMNLFQRLARLVQSEKA